MWVLPDGGTGGMLVLLGLAGMSLLTPALQQCSLPSKDGSNPSLFIALFSQPGCPLPVLCHPSALLALGTLSSQLVLNLGWISPFSGIPVHSDQVFQPAAAHPRPDHTGVKPPPRFAVSFPSRNLFSSGTAGLREGSEVGKPDISENPLCCGQCPAWRSVNPELIHAQELH